MSLATYDGLIERCHYQPYANFGPMVRKCLKVEREDRRTNL